MKVSPDIAILLEQVEQERREKQRRLDAQRQWKEKVGKAVRLLRACQAEERERETLESVVRDYWAPAARAVLACATLQQLRQIPIDPHPLLKAVSRCFQKLVENPESAAVQSVVAGDLAAVVTRGGVRPCQLYVVFQWMADQFEWLIHPRIRAEAPAWMLPGGVTAAAEPDVPEIRARLDASRARRAAQAYGLLCGDKREWIPRPALRSFGLPPTGVDKACRSPLHKQPGRPARYAREFLLTYVRERWRPTRA